ncbi:MAG: AAA family ATPase [Nanoarchaeota archaeon]|nr:AAA family ATPase [Nanoarchaeota archaeon]
MTDLFSSILSAEESLFSNEMALDYDYLPKELPFRENQQKYLAECIQLLLVGRLGKNLLILGKPGIGKTAATKWVLREMEEKGLDEKAKPIFINCWKKDSAHKILLEICLQLNYKWTHNKNTDELFQEVAKTINKSAAVIVLDEVDKLDSKQVIYQLLEDLNRKCFFLITNEEDWLANLDERLRSRLVIETVEFKPYSAIETFKILKHRADHAFVKNVWDDEAFELITERALEKKDIRLGLFLLREAGNIAERKASRKITAEHASQAIEKVCSFTSKEKHEVSEEEQQILELIKENENKTSTEIYQFYNEKENKSYRTFHRKIKSLEEAGLIEIKEDFMAESGGRISRISTK